MGRFIYTKATAEHRVTSRDVAARALLPPVAARGRGRPWPPVAARGRAARGRPWPPVAARGRGRPWPPVAILEPFLGNVKLIF